MAQPFTPSHNLTSSPQIIQALAQHVVIHLVFSGQQPDHVVVINREDEASPQGYFPLPLAIEISLS
jgi:hypothetical protein